MTTDGRVLESFVDTFIVGLICKAGLTVKVDRKPTHTTLKIALNRAHQAS